MERQLNDVIQTINANSNNRLNRSAYNDNTNEIFVRENEREVLKDINKIANIKENKTVPLPIMMNRLNQKIGTYLIAHLLIQLKTIIPIKYNKKLIVNYTIGFCRKNVLYCKHINNIKFKIINIYKIAFVHSIQINTLSLHFQLQFQSDLLFQNLL